MIGESRLLESELARRYGLDTSAEWERLLTHFEWRQAFAFIVLLVPDQYGAEICRHSLEQFLARSDKKLLTFRYARPEDLKKLTEQLMSLEPPAETGAIWVEAVISQAVKEYKSWREAWRVAVAILNRFRNPLMRRFNVPLLFVGAPWLQVLLREIAPDLWSIRTLVVDIEPEATVEREPEFFAPHRSEWIDENAPDPEFALQIAERVRGKAGQELQLASLLHRAGKGFLAQIKWKRAEEVLSEAIDLRKKLAPESEELAEAMLDLAKSLRWQNRSEDALHNLNEALRIYRHTGNRFGQASCFRRLGNISRKKEDNVTAKAQYEKALEIFRQIGDVLGVAKCIRRLGQIALDQANYELAQARFEESLQLCQRIGNSQNVNKCIRDLGNLALVLMDYDTARARFEEALPIARQIGDILTEALCLRGLGDIAFNLSDFLVAKNLYESALKLCRQIESSYLIGRTHQRLARVAADEAERKQHIQAARTIWEHIDRPDLIRELEEEIGRANS
ncbi:MAG: tetratricopeptide repeat protein [Blastocatellia bacterium]